ncbi:MAG: hypothetical protein Q8L48_12855 [Archangium sp.]|nr:hypothetical protein [Archangium sp.]
MSSNHFTAVAAARWVSGLMEEDEARAVEAHAGACRACEALLQAEARAESQLAAAVGVPGQPGAASASVRPLTPTLRRRALPVAGALLALAASVLLVLLRSPAETSSLGAPMDAGEAVSVSDIPIYEGVDVPAEAVTAFAPFGLDTPRYEGDAELVNATFASFDPSPEPP